MKIVAIDGWVGAVSLLWKLLRTGVLFAMVMPKAIQAQAVMTSFVGTTAPGNWELVPWYPTGTYWFDGSESATTLTIAGAVNQPGESLTTVRMKPGVTLGASGYLIFHYNLTQNQATAAELSVYRLVGDQWSLLSRLSGSGTYRSEAVFDSSDRVAFVLSSTLEGKVVPAYANITPIPEPEEWAAVIAVGLGAYVLRHRLRKKAQMCRFTVE